MAAPQLSPKPIGAIMARVSLVKQAKKELSIPVQIEMGRAINERHGLETDERYILEDKGYQGDDWDRPAINKGIALIRARKIAALTFLNSDRFSRDVKGGLEIIEQIKEAGGRIIFGDLGEYTDDANFVLMLTIKMAIGQAEKQKIKTLSRWATEQKIRQGRAHTKVPYGFRREHETIVPVPEEIKVVVQIFGWCDAGWSNRKIVRELKRLCVPPPRKKTDNCAAGNWNVKTISTILHETFYATGVWFYNKRRSVEPKKIRKPHKERHNPKTSSQWRPREEWIPLGGVEKQVVKPIIDVELFARVNVQLSRNVNVLSGRPSDRYPLKSLVWCGGGDEPHRCCGKTQNAHPPSPGESRHNKQRRERRHYMCAHRDRDTGKHLCPNPQFAHAERLEKCVWDACMDSLGDERTLRALVEQHMAQEDREANDKGAAILAAQIEDLKRIEFRARGEELRAKDIETQKFYREQFMQTLNERRSLEADLVALRGKGATGKVDVPAIVALVSKARKCDILDKRYRGDAQEFFQQWVERVLYCEKEVEIELRVPILRENRYHLLATGNSFLLLKIKRLVA